MQDYIVVIWRNLGNWI